MRCGGGVVRERERDRERGVEREREREECVWGGWG